MEGVVGNKLGFIDKFLCNIYRATNTNIWQHYENPLQFLHMYATK